MKEKQAEHKAEYVKPLYDKITKHLDASNTAGQSTTTRTNPAANAGALKNAWESGPLAADFDAIFELQAGHSRGGDPAGDERREGAAV